MESNGCGREGFCGPVQIDTDTGNTQNARFVADNGDTVPLVCGNFTVNKELFQTFAAAGEADAVSRLAGADENIALKDNREGIRGLDDLFGRHAVKIASGTGRGRRHFQNAVVPADGDAAGEISAGGRIVRKDKGFQKPDMNSWS